ncbi:MAG: ABC transporter permease subunit [Clostridiales bacterium]|jgi:putative aldouronate transport system permease protein|nr:ABC transporter permease subunit [Clostridiales bacterium]
MDAIGESGKKLKSIQDQSFFKRIPNDWRRNKGVYLLAMLPMLYYIIFRYTPMFGLVIAFKRFTPGGGIWGSPWAGLANFKMFFGSYYFWRLVSNTFLLSFYNLIWGFPIPIIFALLLNELKSSRFKKAVQTITYMPHFISMVVICGIVLNFVSQNGLITSLLSYLGMPANNLLLDARNFRTVYIASGIWQEMGWSSIIYIAAISGLDQEIYDAATVDGAGRWRKILHVTLPGILPTIVILLILRIGAMMNIGFEKIILLYNPSIYDSADVISSFVYRKGIIQADYSYSTTVGLFNSVINLFLLICANMLSRKVNDTSLW